MYLHRRTQYGRNADKWKKRDVIHFVKSYSRISRFRMSLAVLYNKFLPFHRVHKYTCANVHMQRRVRKTLFCWFVLFLPRMEYEIRNKTILNESLFQYNIKIRFLFVFLCFGFYTYTQNYIYAKFCKKLYKIL